MKRLALTGLLFGMIAASASAATTRVVLVNTSPTVVSGIGFDRSSPVRVTVGFGGRHLTKTVESTSSGAFVARWSTTMTTEPCAQLLIFASSAHHSASVKTVESAGNCGAQRVTP